VLLVRVVLLGGSVKDVKCADRDWIVHQDLIDGVQLKLLANAREDRGSLCNRPEAPTRGRINEFLSRRAEAWDPRRAGGNLSRPEEHRQIESLVISMPTEPYDYDDPDVYRVDAHQGGFRTPRASRDH
jgi:hypothetical protein